mmetsp:Transcript_39788/g.127220  ORF Transcript_39788/g.127220 Transcript_39788/m.127220 type:complete len:97 (+) Transcript_39788:769-1059(+)
MHYYMRHKKMLNFSGMLAIILLDSVDLEHMYMLLLNFCFILELDLLLLWDAMLQTMDIPEKYTSRKKVDSGSKTCIPNGRDLSYSWKVVIQKLMFR